MAWYHATRADERRTHDCGRRAGLRLGLAHKLSTISFRNDRAINFYERFADSGAACMQLRCMCPRTAPGGSERSLTARQRVGSALEVLRCAVCARWRAVITPLPSPDTARTSPYGGRVRARG
jgi:hypothetical protein